MSWVLGLTGGIASGKTTITHAFRSLGMPCVDTDVLAREVVQPGLPAWQALVDRFGDAVLLPDQQLNRAWLRQQIFADPSLRAWVEQGIHPRVRELSWQRLADYQRRAPYAVLISPLLFESQEYRKCQRTLLITLDPGEQLRRLCRRDGCSPEDGQTIIAAQMPQAEKIALADDLLDNTPNSATLTARIFALHQGYLELDFSPC